jgi:putative nucleotidyltransferase with HDIG domain
MSAEGQPASIFSQKLDRAALIAYFLGAIVPLVALALVVDRLADPDTGLPLELTALVASIAVLTGSAFLLLRNVTHRTLRQMKRDNERLAELLEVSGRLAKVEHGRDAAVVAANSAIALSGAPVAYVLMAAADAGAPSPLVAMGKDADKLREAHAAVIDELTELVVREGRPALAGPKGNLGACAAVPLPGDAASLGALVAVHTEPDRDFEPAQLSALSTLAGLAAVSLRNAELRESQRNFFIHVTDILVHALDSHLGYHSGHGVRVAAVANRLGHDLGFDAKRMQRLHFSALLHDIGLIKIDRNLQHDSKACAKHTVLGSRMLGRIRLWQELAPIVHHHHEWYNGSGYPDGIAGEAIPLESRIIALCDAFDSITSRSSYKAAQPVEAAVRELEAFAGTQFDPELVRRFAALVEAGEIVLPG